MRSEINQLQEKITDYSTVDHPYINLQASEKLTSFIPLVIILISIGTAFFGVMNGVNLANGFRGIFSSPTQLVMFLTISALCGILYFLVNTYFEQKKEFLTKAVAEKKGEEEGKQKEDNNIRDKIKQNIKKVAPYALENINATKNSQDRHKPEEEEKIREMQEPLSPKQLLKKAKKNICNINPNDISPEVLRALQIIAGEENRINLEFNPSRISPEGQQKKQLEQNPAELVQQAFTLLDQATQAGNQQVPPNLLDEIITAIENIQSDTSGTLLALSVDTLNARVKQLEEILRNPQQAEHLPRNIANFNNISFIPGSEKAAEEKPESTKPDQKH